MSACQVTCWLVGNTQSFLGLSGQDTPSFWATTVHAHLSFKTLSTLPHASETLERWRKKSWDYQQSKQSLEGALGRANRGEEHRELLSGDQQPWGSAISLGDYRAGSYKLYNPWVLLHKWHLWLGHSGLDKERITNSDHSHLSEADILGGAPGWKRALLNLGPMYPDSLLNLF